MDTAATDTPAPTDAALQPLVDDSLARIRKQVETLVQSRDAGQVVVDVYPDAMGGMFGPIDQPVKAEGFGGMIASASYSQIATIGLGVLSVAFMIWMLRTAGQKPSTPSLRELAGVPPQLPMEEELIGEAGEIESALPGMELDDETLRYRQLAEQVGQVIKSNPDDVATLINRWVRKRD